MKAVLQHEFSQNLFDTDRFTFHLKTNMLAKFFLIFLVLQRPISSKNFSKILVIFRKYWHAPKYNRKSYNPVEAFVKSRMIADVLMNFINLPCF